MDINELLKGVDCACGKHHTCDIEAVYIEKGAIAHLTEICHSYQTTLIVADENTFAAAGEQTLQALIGKAVEKIIFPGDRVLVPDEDAIFAVTGKLGNADLIVGIGSGVIQDLCKYVSFYNSVPYVIVATAPSMDGYASNGAAMITGGMKVTYSVGLPKAILADTEVLKRAPMDMLQAGYGDIVGKFSALNDWKLSHAITGEYFCPYIYDLTFQQIEATLSLADGILRRDEKSVAALMEALVVVGILMRFAGSSRPASGSEHHLSHFFEITGILYGQDYFAHGVDVAYSTVVTAQLRQRLLEIPFSQPLCHPGEKHKQKLSEIYTGIAQSCMDLQEKAGHYSTDRAAIYVEKEAEIKEILAQMPTAEGVIRMLARVGLDMGDFYSLYGKQKLQNAIFYAKDLKDRFTVLWLYYDFFGGESDV